MVANGRKVLGHQLMARDPVGSGLNASPARRRARDGYLPRARETPA